MVKTDQRFEPERISSLQADFVPHLKQEDIPRHGILLLHSLKESGCGQLCTSKRHSGCIQGERPLIRRLPSFHGSIASSTRIVRLLFGKYRRRIRLRRL